MLGKKMKGSHMKNLTLYLKQLEKEGQIKPKLTRRR
jgi:hypothetical protein